MFPYFSEIGLQHETAPGDVSADSMLWEKKNERNETIGRYYNEKIQLQKMLGDTAYGMGQDMVTPVYMGMVIGKHGKIARALRTVMKAAARVADQKVTVDIQ